MAKIPERSVSGDRRPPSRGDRQRALLIEATTDLLATVPIEKLSVSRITEHAGVTRPVFYFYFESKYTVVAAALEQVWSDLEEYRQSVASDVVVDSPFVVTRRQIAGAVDIWRRNSALLSAFAQGRRTDPQLGEMWSQLIAGSSAPIKVLAEDLAKAGRIHPASKDVAALVDVLLGMTLWALLNGDLDDPVERDRIVDAMTAVWVSAAWGVPG